MRVEVYYLGTDHLGFTQPAREYNLWLVIITYLCFIQTVYESIWAVWDKSKWK
jgi:hypothetical protein